MMTSNNFQEPRAVNCSSTGTRYDTALLFFCLAVLGLTILYPSVRLLVQAFMHWNWEFLLSHSAKSAIQNTFIVSLASVFTSGVVGVLLACILTYYRFPGCRILSTLAYLPFTLPPLVGVLSFYYIIGRDGFLPRILNSLFDISNFQIAGFWAILIIHTYSFYVFFYAMVGPALVNLDRTQIEAARTLGAGPVRTFCKVTLPLLRPALYGASLLTFMSSGASFSAPYFFGHNFPMLSVLIYNESSQFHMGNAVTLTLALAIISLFGVIVFRSTRTHQSSAGKGIAGTLRSRSGRILAGILAWLGISILLIPHANILWLSFIDYRAWHTEIFPTQLTLENYRNLLTSPNAFLPIWNSIWMSGLAAFVVLLVALPAAYLISRKRPGGRWVNILVMIPWALPGTVIAINLIIAFNNRWLPLYNTVWLLPLAYFIRNIPLLTRMSGAAMEAFDAGLLEAGRTLGASPRYCFLRIVAPIIAPAVLAGLAMVFATSLGEFVASILLYVPANLPIAVHINMAWRTAIGEAFAYSVLLMFLVGIVFSISRCFTSRLL